MRKKPWRRKWQPTPVFLPGKSHGEKSLVDYSPWGQKESDMTEETEHKEDCFLALPSLAILEFKTKINVSNVGSVFIYNYVFVCHWTSTFISHASNVKLKVSHARLQHYVNQELPDVQAVFRKGRGARDQIANICWITGKAKELQKKKSTSASLIMLKPLIVWITINC